MSEPPLPPLFQEEWHMEADTADAATQSLKEGFKTRYNKLIGLILHKVEIFF